MWKFKNHIEDLNVINHGDLVNAIQILYWNNREQIRRIDELESKFNFLIQQMGIKVVVNTDKWKVVDNES